MNGARGSRRGFVAKKVKILLAKIFQPVRMTGSRMQ
jgi:hypothetical protein